MEIIDQPEQKGNEKDLNDLIQNGYDVKIGEYLSRGMEIFKANMGMFIVYTLLLIVIAMILSVTYVGNILVSGPLTAGFAIVAHRILHKRSHEFGDFFKGFDFFVPLLVAGLLTGIFVAIGMFLLIIPGIYLAVAYSATSYLIVFRKMDFWQAMETSRKAVSKEWFSIFGLGIVLALINLAGALVLGIGLLFTIPLTACAAYAAFADIAGVNGDQP